MRLESVTLHGFKSFGERTTVKILPGITAIVGPNGCGKCLAGDTPVVLADGRRLAIRDLVENALASATAIHHFDDGVAAGGGPDVRVLSLNPDTLRLEQRPVDAFIRRQAPPFLLRVTTRSGREIVSTHYHPFFSVSKGVLDVLTAERLVAGVRIAVPRTLTVKATAEEPLGASLIARIRLSDRLFVPCSEDMRRFVMDAATKVGGWTALARRIGAPESELRGVTAGRPLNLGVVGALTAVTPAPDITSVQCGRRRGRIRVPREFDTRLARFLGLMVAEGRTTASNQVRFVNADPAVNDDFVRLVMELFGVAPFVGRYKKSAVDTIVFSRALCLVLDRVFGFAWRGKSAGKVVPSQLWTAPDEVVGAFLSGLFEGDAFIHAPRDATTGRAMPYVEYTTASRRLADEVATLLLRLGIVPQIRCREKYASNTAARRRRPYWSVYVYGVDQMKRLASHVKFVGAKQARLDATRTLETAGNPNLDVIPGGAALVRRAIVAAGLTVKRLRRRHPRLAAYADARCDPSREGLADVTRIIEALGATPAAAAPLLRRMRALAESDVLWDEVVRVDRIPPPEPWVYDLAVAETHNFVAANIVAHNSNISDAVRWALGEQSAKTLRGHKMEDVIFYGSGSRKAIGLAEVELMFSNDGTLTVPWTEIAVTRRLYRTGESEYLLNKTPSRLRDILDLFAGTGANPRAYSVMDQDKLNHVLTAKPHERRVFIEEAAGIARYKQQRNETQGKLDAARQNLLRVRDVMDEVRRQLSSLERQAKKAQQYKALEAERRDLAVALLAADHVGITAEIETLAAELGRRRDTEQGLRTRIAQLAARQATQAVAIQASDHRLGDLRQAVQKVQAELERLLERREQMGIQLREAADEAVRLEEEIRSATERLGGIVAERETTRGALAEAERLVAGRTEAVHLLERVLEEHRGGLAGDRDRLEALRLEQGRMAAERTDLVRSAGELRERELQLARRAERLASELAEAEAETAQLLAQRAGLEGARDRAAAELTSLTSERQRLAAELAAQERRLAELEARLGDLRLRAAARRSSLEALRELERAREGYGAGVRAVFADEGGAALGGVVGTVADLLEVPPDLERAVEAVLGERLQWIVVERFEHARAAVAYLRQHGGGAATFLPLERLAGNGGAPPMSPHDHGHGLRWLGQSVHARAEHLVDYLLGEVAVVDHLDAAEALWRGNGVVATYVTPAGEVLGPTGRLRGGAGTDAGGAEHSLLGRRRRVRELEDELAALDTELEAAQAETASVGAAVAALRARLPLLEQSIQASEAARVAGEKDLEQSVRDHERVHRHSETIGLEARQVTTERDETTAMLGRLDQRIAAARDAEAAHEAGMTALREAIETAQTREAALTAELTGCRVEVASAAERLEALGREIARLDDIEADLTQRLGQGHQRQTQLGERRLFLAEERERTDAQARDVALDRDRLEGEARGAAEAHEGLLDEQRTVEHELRGVEGELARLIETMHGVELRATERRVRLEELGQEAQRTYGIEPAALAGRHDPSRDVETARQRVADLGERLAAIGPVNLVADDEYRELDERLGFLRTQHDDLVGSIKDLEKALRGMTRTAQDRFLQAFERINTQFGEIFQRLFEGGRAELRLVESEEGGDPLDTGVDLMAQPRGKRLQSVTLMSGGERALTGLALLFAIFYFRPSPFCVLDEVDAPLDDANIHRFLRVLRELTSQTQFLVITHNRNTMEAADVLYGVTMEEPGLSKLVSVNLNA